MTERYVVIVDLPKCESMAVVVTGTEDQAREMAELLATVRGRHSAYIYPVTGAPIVWLAPEEARKAG